MTEILKRLWCKIRLHPEAVWEQSGASFGDLIAGTGTIHWTGECPTCGPVYGDSSLT